MSQDKLNARLRTMKIVGAVCMVLTAIAWLVIVHWRVEVAGLFLW